MSEGRRRILDSPFSRASLARSTSLFSKERKGQDLVLCGSVWLTETA